MKFLQELEDLGLPKDQYAIFGSGPISIRGIRENQDIDILVTKKLWVELKNKYPKGRLSICLTLSEVIEAWCEWLGFTVEEIEKDLIGDSEIIDGFPYVRLEHVIYYKNLKAAEKDLNDVAMIKKYLAHNLNI